MLINLYIIIWFYVFLSYINDLYTIIWFYVLLFNINDLYTIIWFYVFLFNIKDLYMINYMVSSNYSYLIIICLHKVIRLQIDPKVILFQNK